VLNGLHHAYRLAAEQVSVGRKSGRIKGVATTATRDAPAQT
jgi:hypothetical protein